MEPRLTLMAVHAHPDDEVLSTGGLLARCAAEGIRTVLVTCTNGEGGDDPSGFKPTDPEHDAEGVARLRLSELAESARLLGIDHVELLGYRDSGMAGWHTNEHPEAFANVPVKVAAGLLAGLMERYRPQVVVTYDETGGYGHPDHIQAHRITVAATESTGIPAKLYYAAIPRSGVVRLMEYLRGTGMDVGSFDVPEGIGVADELITSIVDVSPYVERKRKALEAHASQGENIFILRLPEEAREMVLGRETFTREMSRVSTPEHEDDLFAGLREDA